jgi:hypothetical protein
MFVLCKIIFDSLLRVNIFARLITAILLIFLLIPFPTTAQEVLLKNDHFHTELFLRIPPTSILSVDRGDNPYTVVVNFDRNISSPFSQNLDDQFIESISGRGRSFIITFRPNADFAVFNDTEGLRFIAIQPREHDDMLLSYGMEAPMLRRDSSMFEDPEADRALRTAENLISLSRYGEAINLLNSVFVTSRSSYYRQEALLRVGTTYMRMAETLNPEHYMDAASTFDMFISTFPDSHRLPVARQLAAQAKDRGQFTS